MRKMLIRVLACALALAVVDCGNPIQACGKTYPTYGLFNSELADPDVKYTIIPGNVVWSIILVETIFAPVYFVGFSLYEPVTVSCDKKP